MSVREEELLEWLEDCGVVAASQPLWLLVGIEIETLDKLMERWRNDYWKYARDMGLRWLALSFDVMSMIGNYGLRGW